MRTVDFFAGALFILTHFFSPHLHAASHFVCASFAPEQTSTQSAKALIGMTRKLPARGQINVLVVFAQFKDEAQTPAPAFAADLFDAQLPGSFTHFYDTMSLGQLQIQGTVLPKRYTSDQPAAAYLADDDSQVGGYGQFAREILRQVDADIDLAQLDNDGRDGQPNSGDDDGVVDYIFINLRSAPRRFIFGGATGAAGLGLEGHYLAADLSFKGKPLRISDSRFRGTVLQGKTFSQTVGTMAHEFGHALGLPDLYNKDFMIDPDQDPAADSAGIGHWGLMGRGAHGWNGDDGPNPFCAWSLEQLGWIGPDNQHLVEITDDAQNLAIPPLARGGAIYKIPLNAKFLLDNPFFSQEYLLLEQRTRTDHFYNRNLPGQGLLIWHVRPVATIGETDKRLDLVCADGLYKDAGFPRGQIPDTHGGDNLDFWAHDAAYTRAHAGNLGDATDVFDGRRFTRFDLDFLPARLTQSLRYPAVTGLLIDSMHQRDHSTIVDIRQPRWSGTIRQTVHWQGQILVDGDLTIAPEGELIIHSNTQVRVAGTDHSRSGSDPEHCEMRVQGKLNIDTKAMHRFTSGRTALQFIPSSPVVFAAQSPGSIWQGILLTDRSQVHIPEKSLVLEDAACGMAQSTADCTISHMNPPTAVDENPSVQTTTSHLQPNYPNPFNAQTTLRFTLAQTAQVQLTLYNTMGQKIRTLVEGVRPKGEQAISWNSRDENGQEVASGSYFYRFEVDGQHLATRQMVLTR